MKIQTTFKITNFDRRQTVKATLAAKLTDAQEETARKMAETFSTKGLRMATKSSLRNALPLAIAKRSYKGIASREFDRFVTLAAKYSRAYELKTGEKLEISSLF